MCPLWHSWSRASRNNWYTHLHCFVMSTMLKLHQITYQKNKWSKKSFVDSKEKFHLTWYIFDARSTDLKCYYYQLEALKSEIERLREPLQNSNASLVSEMYAFLQHQQDEWNTTPDFIRHNCVLIETLNNKGSEFYEDAESKCTSFNNDILFKIYYLW